ncbi:hypothetical protein HAX54_036280 [Datura stramonium]|uniref:Uncharacterized protein n=1 Tax=Datura stramonium TaxID=4076 RepID=A0ABS8RMB1_DATST|nr:hypothetical protein [Datura stramonium]
MEVPTAFLPVYCRQPLTAIAVYELRCQNGEKMMKDSEEEQNVQLKAVSSLYVCDQKWEEMSKVYSAVSWSNLRTTFQECGPVLKSRDMTKDLTNWRPTLRS